MKILFAAFLSIFLCGASSSAEPVTDISMVQLIANPSNYDGKLVRLIAFMHLEFEGDALYLHREDFDRSIFKNGVWIDLSDTQMKSAAGLNDHYVIVEGQFNASKQGHLGMWSGSLQNIDRLSDWPMRRSRGGSRK